MHAPITEKKTSQRSPPTVMTLEAFREREKERELFYDNASIQFLMPLLQQVKRSTNWINSTRASQAGKKQMQPRSCQFVSALQKYVVRISIRFLSKHM